MSALDQMKSSLTKSAGMLSIVPPVVATGIALRVVEKSFKPYFKKKR